MLKASAILATLWIFQGAAVAAESTVHASPSTIRVVARATIAVKPDQAEIDLGVTTEKKTAAAAIAENEGKMEQVLAVLKKEVGADGEVKTSELSVQPRFEEYRKGPATPRIVSYTVTNRVQVRITKISAVGRILDLSFQAGANTVERVDFTLKDPEAAQNQALRAASAKARARATALAEGQGLRAGDVISVSEGDASPFEHGSFALRANAEKNFAMPIVAGAVEVSATVTVIFALKAR